MRTKPVQTATAADRHQQMRAAIFYLFAVVLPLGSLLILLRWWYLRHHM